MLKDIQSLSHLHKLVNSLKKIDCNKASYEYIFNYIKDEISFIPFTIARLHAGHYIERARIHNTNEIFNSEKEISYIQDPTIIRQFGRANKPGQSMFYGAVKSDDIEYPRIVNLAEITDVLRNSNKDNVTKDFFVTVGKWEILKDIDVIEMVFKKELIEQVTDVRRAYESQIERIQNDLPDHVGQMKFLLEFFSDEYAKTKINTDHDYMISAAYTNLALTINGISGVVYPSVRTEYRGTNVALTPEAVNNHLELKTVGMFHVCIKDKNVFVNNLRVATDLGEANSNFKWIELDGAKQEVIKQHLDKKTAHNKSNRCTTQ